MGALTDAVQQAWKTMEAGDLDALDGLLVDDVVFEFPGVQLAGPEAVKQMVQGWFAAFPDLHHRTDAEFEHDGSYACRLTLTGTHNGPFVTPNGEIAPTGRKIEFVSADYITGEDGRIATWHAYPDMAGVLAQIT